MNEKHAPDKRDCNCVECIGPRRPCHTCQTVSAYDSRRRTAALPWSCARRPSDRRLMCSLGFTPANTSLPTTAGMTVCRSSVRLPGMCTWLHCRRSFTGGSCDKAKNLNGRAVEAEATVEFRSPSLNRQGSCRLNHIRGFRPFRDGFSIHTCCGALYVPMIPVELQKEGGISDHAANVL